MINHNNIDRDSTSCLLGGYVIVHSLFIQVVIDILSGFHHLLQWHNGFGCCGSRTVVELMKSHSITPGKNDANDIVADTLDIIIDTVLVQLRGCKIFDMDYSKMPRLVSLDAEFMIETNAKLLYVKS